MNSEMQKIIEQMQKLAPPRDVPLSNPDIVHTYQTLYMARLLVLIAEDQAKASERMEQQTDRLVNQTDRLVNFTKGLYWFTVALLVLGVVQLIVAFFPHP